MTGRAPESRKDAYSSFAELCGVEREGADFRVHVVRRPLARIVVVAPHGGGIEPGTSEIARGIAGADLSLALFEGLKSGGNHRLHVTSTNFDEPRCLELIAESEHVLAIHGERGETPVVHIGGRDAELGARIGAELMRRGHVLGEHSAAALQGVDPRNLCNRGRTGAGVQLELSAGLRRTFFANLTASGRARPTPELERFVHAVRAGLLSAVAS